jgi:hypothetical protein
MHKQFVSFYKKQYKTTSNRLNVWISKLIMGKWTYIGSTEQAQQNLNYRQYEH